MSVGLSFSVIGSALVCLFLASYSDGARTIGDGSAAAAVGCRPAVSSYRRSVAPGLTLLKISRAYGTCPQAIRVNSRGPANTIWGTDSTNGLWRSTNDLRTWTLMYRAAGYVSIDNVLRLKSGHVLIVVQRSDGRRFILRSRDTAGRRFAGPVFTFPFNPSVHSLGNAPGILSGQSWLQSGGAIYIGEYGNSLNPVYLWKSTNDGRSFGVAATFTGVAHVHSIYIDPYVPGRLWIAIGDSGAAPRIGYSSDGGASFTWITQGKYPLSRAVGLLFTRDAVYWASDTPEVPAGFYRWDRSTHAITEILGNLNGPWFYTAQARSGYVIFSYIDSRKRAGYLGDEFIHVVTSQGGEKWTTSRTALKRDPAALQSDRKAGPIAVTKPDAQGRFWVYFYSLQGGQGFTTNVEYRLGR